VDYGRPAIVAIEHYCTALPVLLFHDSIAACQLSVLVLTVCAFCVTVIAKLSFRKCAVKKLLAHFRRRTLSVGFKNADLQEIR